VRYVSKDRDLTPKGFTHLGPLILDVCPVKCKPLPFPQDVTNTFCADAGDGNTCPPIMKSVQKYAASRAQRVLFIQAMRETKPASLRASQA